MLEINEEDRMKAELYFNEQQAIQNQQQGHYGPISTGQQLLTNTAAGTIQLDHQLFTMSQSPRLKPINIIDKQIITNPQAINHVLTAPNGFISNQKLKKNPYDKINQARYRNLY